ncbi:ABC transporter substrate-binding protein [Frankia sp. AgB1.9]|uniref:ABC transporter substrate-binding protein n=1 Tax=unclassified Frankia TaxID=2632575 RepID=UPI001932FB26|nr:MULTISPECIES: ABC transporter substrate-binding protein [unclassified Frankia]MBL7489684.1 ABC transporter substrate-binding protein [Frankia sp. AgW1.1]MBL7550721.1 ABC transporter substrate-binding protein [Frankia sp. AgB1.9]MBL7624339.1 ABC transporter substrate-binding protein [Frankia sp. AgB1.8]
MNPWRLRAWTTALATAVLVGLPGALAGCGDSSRPAGGLASSCSTPMPGVTPRSIKVGFIFPDSGPHEIVTAFQGSRSGVQARVDLQNARGGLDGRMIDLAWGDDQSSASTFSQVAHQLVDTQQVFGLITATIVLDQSAGWLRQGGIPVTGSATSGVWSENSNLFSFGGLFGAGDASVFGDFVRAQGGTKALVVIDPVIAASRDLAARFTRSLRSRGIQVVGEVTYAGGATSAARVAEQLKDLGADTLVGAAQSGPFIDIYAQAKSLGARIAVALNSTGFSPSLLTARGKDMGGMSIISPLAAQGSPAMIAYEAAMRTYAPEQQDPTDELAVAGYLAADEMIQGLQLAGKCPTRAAFIQNLRKVTDFTGGGLIAPVDLSRPKNPTTCENFIKVDPTGRTFAAVPPPAALDVHGYWCGAVLTD